MSEIVDMNCENTSEINDADNIARAINLLSMAKKHIAAQEQSSGRAEERMQSDIDNEDIRIHRKNCFICDIERKLNATHDSEDSDTSWETVSLRSLKSNPDVVTENEDNEMARDNYCLRNMERQLNSTQLSEDSETDDVENLSSNAGVVPENEYNCMDPGNCFLCNMERQLNSTELSEDSDISWETDSVGSMTSNAGVVPENEYNDMAPENCFLRNMERRLNSTQDSEDSDISWETDSVGSMEFNTGVVPDYEDSDNFCESCSLCIADAQFMNECSCEACNLLNMNENFDAIQQDEYNDEGAWEEMAVEQLHSGTSLYYLDYQHHSDNNMWSTLEEEYAEFAESPSSQRTSTPIELFSDDSNYNSDECNYVDSMDSYGSAVSDSYRNTPPYYQIYFAETRDTDDESTAGSLGAESNFTFGSACNCFSDGMSMSCEAHQLEQLSQKSDSCGLDLAIRLLSL